MWHKISHKSQHIWNICSLSTCSDVQNSDVGRRPTVNIFPIWLRSNEIENKSKMSKVEIQPLNKQKSIVTIAGAKYVNVTSSRWQMRRRPYWIQLICLFEFLYYCSENALHFNFTFCVIFVSFVYLIVTILVEADKMSGKENEYVAQITQAMMSHGAYQQAWAINIFF